MKDEIKEIIDRLERIDHKEYIAFEFADSATFDEMARCFEERKKLADYITNLQEENEGLHTRIKTIKRRRKAQTAKMRKYREEITNKQNSIVDYKSRNEKANEYIKEHTNNFVEYLDVYETKELSNILEGDKDE